MEATIPIQTTQTPASQTSRKMDLAHRLVRVRLDGRITVVDVLHDHHGGATGMYAWVLPAGLAFDPAHPVAEQCRPLPIAVVNAAVAKYHSDAMFSDMAPAHPGQQRPAPPR